MTNNINYFFIPQSLQFSLFRFLFFSLVRQLKWRKTFPSLFSVAFRAYLGRSPSKFVLKQFSSNFTFLFFSFFFVKITHESFSQYWLPRARQRTKDFAFCLKKMNRVRPRDEARKNKVLPLKFFFHFFSKRKTKTNKFLIKKLKASNFH